MHLDGELEKQPTQLPLILFFLVFSPPFSCSKTESYSVAQAGAHSIAKVGLEHRVTLLSLPSTQGDYA